MTDAPAPFAVSLTREALLGAVAAVLDHAPRQALAVFEADGETLAVTASGPDGGARCTLSGVAVSAPGRAVLSLAPLAHALKYSDGRVVELARTRDGVRATVDSDILPARSFDFLGAEAHAVAPAPDPGPAAEPVELDAGEFRALVARTAFAGERREHEHASAWAVTGALVTLERSRLTLCATDTYRLAVSRMALRPARTLRTTPKFLVPLKALRGFAEAARACDRVTLTLSPTLAALDAGSFRVWSPLLTGNFPPAAAALADLPHGLSLCPTRLLADVEAATAFTDPEEPVVILAAAPGLLSVSPQSGERGTCELVTRLPGFTGPRVTAALHGPHLAAVLAAYRDCAEVSLRWQEAANPFIQILAGQSRCLLSPRVMRERNAA